MRRMAWLMVISGLFLPATGALADTVPAICRLSPDSCASAPTLGCGAPLYPNGSCLAPTPPPDSAQLVTLDRYLYWREAVPEASEPWLNAAGMRRLYYLIDGARRPGILSAGIDVVRVEIIQFPTEEAAKEFDPFTQTDLGVYRTDLNGAGELERYITYHTQTVRNGNVVMFIDLGSEPAAPEDVASIRRVRDRLVAAFNDDDWQWWDMTLVAEEEAARLREWRQGLFHIESCGLPSPADAARLPRTERGEFRERLRAALVNCRRLVPQLESALDALNADEPWRVPTSVCGMDAVRLLAARADSDAYLADRRKIEFAAIDALFAVPVDALPDTTDDEPAIIAALEADAALREHWQRHQQNNPMRFSGLRVYGALVGITVSGGPETTFTPPLGRDHSRCHDELRDRPIITHLCSGRPPSPPSPPPAWALALYLRKTDAGWVICNGVPRHEAPWQ